MPSNLRSTFPTGSHSIFTLGRWEKWVWKSTVTRLSLHSYKMAELGFTVKSSRSRYTMLLSLHNCNNFHALTCDFLLPFHSSYCIPYSVGHRWAITNCWLDMTIDLSTFWEARDRIRSNYLGAYYSIMCWQEHSWLKMSEFFKTHFNSVFDHYIRSAINQNDYSFPLTVKQY